MSITKNLSEVMVHCNGFKTGMCVHITIQTYWFIQDICIGKVLINTQKGEYEGMYT